MEQYAYRALSYELFCRVLEEPEFRDWPDVGIVVQAYHGDAENELRMLREWVERAGHSDHDPAGQGSLLGLRSRDRAATGLAGAGFSREVAERCVVRALRAVFDRAS